MVLSFELINTGFTQLHNFTVFKPNSSVSTKLPCTTASWSFSDKVSAFLYQFLPNAANKLFPWGTRVFCRNFAQLLIYDFLCKVSTKLKHHFIHKSVMSFEPVVVNVNFVSVSLCERVNVDRSAFCHPHIYF